MILLSAVVVLGVLSSLRFQSAGWPGFLTPALHRNVALMTLVFLGLHIVTAVADPFTHPGWLPVPVPFSSYYRPLWLGLAPTAFQLRPALAVTGLLRHISGQA